MNGVNKNMVVTIRYIMRNGRGEVLEDTMTGTAASYLHGSPGILESLQSQLEGLKAGERKQVFLRQDPADQEYDFSFDVWVEKVREAVPAELQLGYPLTPVAVECPPGCSCYY